MLKIEVFERKSFENTKAGYKTGTFFVTDLDNNIITVTTIKDLIKIIQTKYGDYECIDELLQQLMNIKEIYPDSGRWLVSIENVDYGIEWLPNMVKRNGNSNELVIK